MFILDSLKSLSVENVRLIRSNSYFQADGQKFKSNLILEITSNSAIHRFIILQRKRAPFPSEIEKLPRAIPGPDPKPLLLAPYISKTVGQKIIDKGWCWADDLGNLGIVAQGITLFCRVLDKPQKLVGDDRFPHGSISTRVIRWLIHNAPHNQSISVTDVAKKIGVTQPRVSQICQHLGSLGMLKRTPTRKWLVERELLLESFLTNYEGPGGSNHFYYSLSSPLETAKQIAISGSSSRWAVSADLGPDLLASYRTPTHLIIYTDDLDGIIHPAWVKADGPGDANVIIRMPDDESVYSSDFMRVQIENTIIPIADIAQCLWDLNQLGGSDRIIAAEILQRWYIQNLRTSSL